MHADLPSGFLKETFYRAQLCLQELEKNSIPGSTVIFLIGNKTDLDHSRQVSEEVQQHTSSFNSDSSQVYIHSFYFHATTQEGQRLASDRGLYFTETSALSGDRVNQLLEDVGRCPASRKLLVFFNLISFYDYNCVKCKISGRH